MLNIKKTQSYHYFYKIIATISAHKFLFARKPIRKWLVTLPVGIHFKKSLRFSLPRLYKHQYDGVLLLCCMKIEENIIPLNKQEK